MLSLFFSLYACSLSLSLSLSDCIFAFVASTSISFAPFVPKNTS